MSDISCAPLLLTSTGTKRRRQDTLTVFLKRSPLEDLDSLTRWSRRPCAFSPQNSHPGRPGPQREG